MFLLRFLPVLPLPCVRFPSVSPLRSPRRLRVRLLPLPRVSLRDGSSASVVFSPSFPFLASSSLQFGYVFLSFPLRFLQLPFPFLPLPFVQFSPVLSTLVRFGSPAVFPPTGVPTLPRSPSGSRVPPPLSRGFVLWPAGRAEALPHHSKEAAKITGQVYPLKPFQADPQSTGNRGTELLISIEFKSREAASDAPSGALDSHRQRQARAIPSRAL